MHLAIVPSSLVFVSLLHPTLVTPNLRYTRPLSHPNLLPLGVVTTRLCFRKALLPPGVVTIKLCYHQAVLPPGFVTTRRCYHQALLPPGCVTTRLCYHQAWLPQGCVTIRLCNHQALLPPGFVTFTINYSTNPCCIPSILFTHRPICCARRGLMRIASKTHVGNHRCHRRHRSVGFLQRQKPPKSMEKAMISSR